MEDDDDLEKDGLLIASSPEPEPLIEHHSHEPEEENDEGSGESSPQPIVIEEDEESSGEGSGIIPINVDASTLGIYEEVSEEPLAPGVQKSGVDKNPEDVETPGVVENQKGDLKTAQVEDNKGTYILLAVIGLLLASLIAFVAYKNKQEKRTQKRRYDVEKEMSGRNGGTELQDMDKRLLGKPLEKNGNGKHENSPLINGEKEGAFTPYKPPAITVDEPIQELPRKEKSQPTLHENNFEPIEPIHATNGAIPRSPDSDEEVFHPAIDTLNGPESLDVSPEQPKRYSPIYSPASPRSARYSPVYSPETGRVKIKLTETPKPKTPVVVNRSRSRAGDYVNTPNDQ